VLFFNAGKYNETMFEKYNWFMHNQAKKSGEILKVDVKKNILALSS